MSENCTHDCANCSANCASRENAGPQLSVPKETTHIAKIIAVMSGKGGVGKSMVSATLATELAKQGYKTAVLDADITGPSIPKLFGVSGNPMGDDTGIYPFKSEKLGIKLMSTNFLLQDETQPVIWRGPVLSGMVQQFYTEVYWEDVDYMIIDMPPGTGDVPITLFQSLPVNGIVIVTSPQELVSMIVSKALNMAQMVNIPVVGLVENMSYFECPDNGKKYEIFGKSHVDETAKEFGIPVLAKVPINPTIAEKSDAGKIEDVDAKWLTDAIEKIKKI